MSDAATTAGGASALFVPHGDRLIPTGRALGPWSPGALHGGPVAALATPAAVADFGNGVAAELAFGSSLFVNLDLTVWRHRPPVGEWVCLDARTRFGTPGVGAVESALRDVEGGTGRSVQNPVVEVGR